MGVTVHKNFFLKKGQLIVDGAATSGGERLWVGKSTTCRNRQHKNFFQLFYPRSILDSQYFCRYNSMEIK